jgi:hypothetical protein
MRYGVWGMWKTFYNILPHTAHRKPHTSCPIPVLFCKLKFRQSLVKAIFIGK